MMYFSTISVGVCRFIAKKSRTFAVAQISINVIRRMASKTRIVNGFVESDVKLNGKTVVITGANSGIGYETALDLAGRGAKIIMACRDLTKAESAKSKILEAVKKADIKIKKLDLSSLMSVRECAKEINDSEARLDLLINNAGIMMCPQWKTEDGYEMQLGVNHVGHFLFTNLLLDLLKRSAPSRIVIVSSIAHKGGRFNWDDVMQEKRYDTFGAYQASKLANVFHCLELSRRLENTGVTCNCLHPGVIKTELGRHVQQGDHLPMKYKIGWKLFSPFSSFFLITPKKGAQTTLYCALAPELETVSGKYFSDCAMKQLQSRAENMEEAKKLWELSEDWTKEK